VIKKTVLLVEDNADDEHLTLRGLRKHSSPPEVHVARDGSQALDFLTQAEADQGLPDLVLLDLKLPKLGGLEVLRRIRTNPGTSAVPVVVLTSSDEEGDVTRAYMDGVNSYVCKPVDYNAFLTAVGAIAEFWLDVSALPTERPDRARA
jgi:two-component system, response regulator